MLAVAGDATTVQLRHARSGELQATLAGHDLAVVGMAFSPDGRTLATQGGELLKLWHVPTRREVGTLSYPHCYLAFSPDGTLLLLVGYGSIARLLHAPYPQDAAPPP